MTYSDPYSPERHYYECLDCLHRVVADEPLARCPRCSGRLRNIAVPRE